MGVRGFKEARKRKGLSQFEAASKLGVSLSAVCAWESGLYKPSTDRLPEIAELYGCTTDELLGLNDRQRDSA